MLRVRSAESRTEILLHEMLVAQGWTTRKPPQGDLLIKQEYKDYPDLMIGFRSKTGPGMGLPEGVLVDQHTVEPLAIIEAKATKAQIDQALSEAQGYADTCQDGSYKPIAIGIAGDEDSAEVKVAYWSGKSWLPVTYEGNPISWIPSKSDVLHIKASAYASQRVDLRPSVPPPAVLNAKAEEINGLLRESKLKDEYRPGAVAAIILALWHTKGQIRRQPDYILQDINAACERAFEKAGKSHLAKSLRVDPANRTLAVKTRQICTILEALNVTVLTAEHDYIGQLYEAFFRYTGGNTIGQYFTPRHITQLAADITQVTSRDIVLDPACGTGGFLIAAMDRMIREEKLTRQEVVKLVATHLVGFETEPVTASLCVANMILRGDGTTGIHQEDSFLSLEYPEGAASVVLMNPPFPHEETDTPPELFVDRALQGLRDRGLLAVIVPSSLMVKTGAKAKWRESVLKDSSLRAVISLPDELFQPYAAATTSLVVIEKGVTGTAPTFFARIANDGLKIKKRVRQHIEGSEIPVVLEAFRNHQQVPNLTGWAVLQEKNGWAPGAYIPLATHSEDELMREIRGIIRSRVAFVVQHAEDLQAMNEAIALGSATVTEYGDLLSSRRRAETEGLPDTLGHYFDIYYGQKDLHNKSNLVSGNSLVISSSSADNGCYGFFDFEKLIKPPFVTVPSTGSIGEARVQSFPCGVTDDCLLLLPREGVTEDFLYVAAAALRLEKWRFDYGRKMTPDRVRDIPLVFNDALFAWVKDEVRKSQEVQAFAVETLTT